MPVIEQYPITSATGNGVTTVFPYQFQIAKKQDIKVTVAGVTKTLDVDYTVSNVGAQAGGDITFLTGAPANGALVRFIRDMKLDRSTDYQENGDLLAATLDADQDREWLALQQLAAYLGIGPNAVARALLLGESDIDGSGTYRARQNRIQDLADPVNQQDAANRRWAVQLVADSLTDGSGNAVLQLLANTTDPAKGVALVGGAVRSVATYAAVRTFSGTATRLEVGGRANYFDGAHGFFVVDSSDSTSADNDGTILVDASGRRWKRQFTGRVKAVWFGVVAGDLTQSYSTKVQSAVTVGCTSHGGVDFPKGSIRLDTTITFPNAAFDLYGLGGTGTEFVTGVANLTLFDLTNCNGPSKTINNLGFGTTTPGNYNGVKAIKTQDTNGLWLNFVWARGVQYGLEYHGSLINLNMVTFEFCYRAINCLTSCSESVWQGTTFYKNEIDVILTGDNETFESQGSNHIGTKDEMWRFFDCNGAQVFGVSAKDDGTGYTPIIARITGNSQRNYVNGVTVKNFGARVAFFEGAGVTNNHVIGIKAKGNLAVGSIAVLASASSGNTSEGLIDGYETGIKIDTCSHRAVGNVKNCTTGVNLLTANNSILDLDMSGNTTDLTQSGTTIIDLIRFNGNQANLSGIPYLVTSRDATVDVATTSSPAALTWSIGDRAFNRTPAVGQPKGWLCTVAGTPGTWVSEGNL